jgi:hypothetical protein
MRRTKKTIALLLLAAIAVIPAIGCMDLTTAPLTPRGEAQSATTTPSTTAQSTTTTVHVVNGRPVENSGLIGGLIGLVGDVVTGTVNLITDTIGIDGSVGGTLTNGRWTVAVPPDAVTGEVSVSVTVTSLTSNRVDLSITPGSQNHFDKPVILTVDCSTMQQGQLRNLAIYWLDPSVGTWVQVDGSTVDMTHRTVSAPLQHFSTYCTGPAGGKVGW